MPPVEQSSLPQETLCFSSCICHIGHDHFPLKSEIQYLRRSLAIVEEARSTSQCQADYAVHKRHAAEKKMRLYAEMYAALQDQYSDLVLREAELRRQALSAAEKHASDILRMRLKHDLELNELRAEMDALRNKLHRSPAQTQAYPAFDVQPSWDHLVNEWMSAYEDRWNIIMDNSTMLLTFAHFPWPTFRPVRTLEDLDGKEIREFLATRYPGELKQKWREDLKRWHPDKLPRLSGKICPHSKAEIDAGFSICIRVMTSFQEEKERKSPRKN